MIMWIAALAFLIATALAPLDAAAGKGRKQTIQDWESGRAGSAPPDRGGPVTRAGPPLDGST